jgi:hypothetical protein
MICKALSSGAQIVMYKMILTLISIISLTACSENKKIETLRITTNGVTLGQKPIPTDLKGRYNLDLKNVQNTADFFKLPVSFRMNLSLKGNFYLTDFYELGKDYKNESYLNLYFTGNKMFIKGKLCNPDQFKKYLAELKKHSPQVSKLYIKASARSAPFADLEKFLKLIPERINFGVYSPVDFKGKIKEPPAPIVQVENSDSLK